MMEQAPASISDHYHQKVWLSTLGRGCMIPDNIGSESWARRGQGIFFPSWIRVLARL